MKRTMVLVAVLATVLFCGVARAAVPEVISFQGKLGDAAGDPVAGTVSVVFTLYDSGGGGGHPLDRDARERLD